MNLHASSASTSDLHCSLHSSSHGLSCAADASTSADLPLLSSQPVCRRRPSQSSRERGTRDEAAARRGDPIVSSQVQRRASAADSKRGRLPLTGSRLARLCCLLPRSLDHFRGRRQSEGRRSQRSHAQARATRTEKSGRAAEQIAGGREETRGREQSRGHAGEREEARLTIVRGCWTAPLLLCSLLSRRPPAPRPALVVV